MKKTQITKNQAIQLYGSQSKLAKALSITKGAVSQWPEGPIPEKQALKLIYELKPDAFTIAYGFARFSANND
tara:strand:+ start:103 stop:318 length:216 start_codon:yes stop_codon:yes gene_type:complete